MCLVHCSLQRSPLLMLNQVWHPDCLESYVLHGKAILALPLTSRFILLLVGSMVWHQTTALLHGITQPFQNNKRKELLKCHQVITTTPSLPLCFIIFIHFYDGLREVAHKEQKSKVFPQSIDNFPPMNSYFCAIGDWNRNSLQILKFDEWRYESP